MRLLTGYIALSIEKRQYQAVLLNWIESSDTRKKKERGSKDRMEGKTKKFALVASSHDANYIRHMQRLESSRTSNSRTKSPERENLVNTKEKKQQWIILSKHQLMTLG